MYTWSTLCTTAPSLIHNISGSSVPSRLQFSFTGWPWDTFNLIGDPVNFIPKRKILLRPTPGRRGVGVQQITLGWQSGVTYPTSTRCRGGRLVSALLILRLLSNSQKQALKAHWRKAVGECIHGASFKLGTSRVSFCRAELDRNTGSSPVPVIPQLQACSLSTAPHLPLSQAAISTTGFLRC